MHYQKNLFIAITVMVLVLTVAVGCSTAAGTNRRDAGSDQRISEASEDEYSEQGDRDEAKPRPSMAARDDEESSENPSTLRKERFFQVGPASWYGREFHGRMTASGDRFSMYAYTAAHKTLPFGTVLEVRNLDNGKIVKVKINDRGPYKGKRIIDLSFNAAKKLGMVGKGTAQVGIRILKKGEDTGDDVATDTRKRTVAPVADDSAQDEETVERSDQSATALQVGAFYSRRNAEQLKKKVEGMTEKGVSIRQDGDLFKVRIEGITNTRDLSRFKRLLNDENIPSYEVK